MKRCNIILGQDKYINVAADRMEVKDNMLYVFLQNDLQAIADISTVLEAHISEKGEFYADKN